MCLSNNVTEFILLGLTQDSFRKKMLFVVPLLFYKGTLLGNLLIIATIKTSQTLESPMYFFLFYLSLPDNFFSTAIAPRTIVDSLMKEASISFNESIIQVYTFNFFGCLEIFMLPGDLMAVDCYVAICKPLHSMTTMSLRVCGVLVAIAWVGSCMHSLVQIFLAWSLYFCGPKEIGHYFCDLQPLLKLACSDTYMINLLPLSNSGATCTVSLLVLMVSYVINFYSLRSHGAEGRKKPYPSVSLTLLQSSFSLDLAYLYTYALQPLPMDKIMAIFYSIGTPSLTPQIYTLR